MGCICCYCFKVVSISLIKKDCFDEWICNGNPKLDLVKFYRKNFDGMQKERFDSNVNVITYK